MGSPFSCFLLHIALVMISVVSFFGIGINESSKIAFQRLVKFFDGGDQAIEYPNSDVEMCA